DGEAWAIMIKRLLGTSGVLALVLAAATGITFIAPAHPPVAEPVEMPRTSRVTCLVPGDAIFASDAVTVNSLGSGDPLAPTVVTSDTSIVGGVLTAPPARAYVPCAGAVTSGVVL